MFMVVVMLHIYSVLHCLYSVGNKITTTTTLDTTVMLGPLQFNLQATIDHHGPSIDSSHYTASINCCKKNILLQRSQNYGVWNY